MGQIPKLGHKTKGRPKLSPGGLPSQSLRAGRDQPASFFIRLLSCMATDMSPATFSLPCMKAMVGSIAPDAILAKSSQLTLIVASAGSSELLAVLLTPSIRSLPTLPKSNLTFFLKSLPPAMADEARAVSSARSIRGFLLGNWVWERIKQTGTWGARRFP